MKKYRITAKHPWFKEDVFEYEKKGGRLYLGNPEKNLPLTLDIFEATLNHWLKNGWIEEIQELKFTELEALTFAVHYASLFYNTNKESLKVDDIFGEWVRNNNKT